MTFVRMRDRFVKQSSDSSCAPAASGDSCDYAEMVRRIIADVEDGVPTFRAIAAMLSVSERTLRRRLKLRDTSYSKILQEVRMDTAVAALRSSALTVDEIAARVGYTETTNFRHAFRRWLGLSPREFRLGIRGTDSEITKMKVS